MLNEQQPKQGRRPERPLSASQMLGVALRIEAIVGGLASIPLVLTGSGLLGLIAAPATFWAGRVLAGLPSTSPKLAAAAAGIGGALLVVSIFFMLLIGNCGVVGGGCRTGSEPFIWGIPILLMLFNIVCTQVLWVTAPRTAK